MLFFTYLMIAIVALVAVPPPQHFYDYFTSLNLVRILAIVTLITLISATYHGRIHRIRIPALILSGLKLHASQTVEANRIESGEVRGVRAPGLWPLAVT